MYGVRGSGAGSPVVKSKEQARNYFFWGTRADTELATAHLDPAMAFVRALFLALCFAACKVRSDVNVDDGIIDTEGWIGAEYQPSRSSNAGWWANFDAYAAGIARELRQTQRALGFTAIRVFLHSMLYRADPSGLLDKIDRFLTIAKDSGMGVGFVFFDDCWSHSGFNLSDPCQPRKGVHNGCWMASPQDWERTVNPETDLNKTVAGFENYVKDTVSRFRGDPRVLWWEIFNEPHLPPSKFPQGDFSQALRHAAYGWATAAEPSQPVLSCWDENTDTQLVDHHQYASHWGLAKNGVFVNKSGSMRGGLVTEAGARWYQGQPTDSGSPLTVIDWLSRLRALGDSAPFVPGAMLAWEVMVSNSNTRWHWGDPEGTPEPSIPWHQHVFPDGTPVSYTEAAAIRRYVTGDASNIWFLEDFLGGDTNMDSAELFRTLKAGGGSFDASVDPGPNTTCCPSLFEASVRPADNKTIIRLDLCLARAETAGSYSVIIDAAARTLVLADSSGRSLQSFNVSSVENGLVVGAWNMLRVRVAKPAESDEPDNERVQVWINPTFGDVFPNGPHLPGGSLKRIVPMPPRIDTVARAPSSGQSASACASVSAEQGSVDLDYLSILPPTLYGEPFDPPKHSV